MFTLPDLSDYGIDLSAGLAHMDGQSALYLRFLKQFPEDDNAQRLAHALVQGDLSQAFACAHTLKGLSAQFGLTRLCELSTELCDVLRAPDEDAPARAQALLELVQYAHGQAVRGIEKLE